MIGSLDGARAALVGTLAYLDEGSARRVYRDGNVVYKVEIDIGSNLIEWENYQKAVKQDYPADVKLAKTYLHEVDGKPVIAMQYIAGQPIGLCWCQPNEEHLPNCMSDEEAEYLHEFTPDLSGLNVVRSNRGVYYLIDFDCY